MTKTKPRRSRNETTERMLLRVMRIAELLVREMPSEQDHPTPRDGQNQFEVNSVDRQAKNAPIVQARENGVR